MDVKGTIVIGSLICPIRELTLVTEGVRLVADVPAFDGELDTVGLRIHAADGTSIGHVAGYRCRLEANPDGDAALEMTLKVANIRPEGT